MPIKWRTSTPASMSTSSVERARRTTTGRVVAFLHALNRRPAPLAILAYVLVLLPAAGLGWDVGKGTLGINPLQVIVRRPGHWALVLLICVLAITPLRHALTLLMRRTRVPFGRRLADWNWLVRIRRPLGLASFFYAAAHLALYAFLDLDLEWREFLVDLKGKPFVLAGLGAFVLLLPLALTSTDAWIRRLKRKWKRLHELVYPAAALVALHFIWLSKAVVAEPYPYAAAIFGLLGYRAFQRWKAARGMPEVPETEAEERASRPA
jgi:sulfoxide reductase heme-binding subunit YedZ